MDRIHLPSLALALLGLTAGCAAKRIRDLALLPVGAEVTVSGVARPCAVVCTDASCPDTCCNVCAVKLGLAEDDRGTGAICLAGADLRVRECDLGKLPLATGTRYLVEGQLEGNDPQLPRTLRARRWRPAAGGPRTDASAATAQLTLAPPQVSAGVLTVQALLRDAELHVGKEVVLEAVAQPCGSRRCTKRRCSPADRCCNRCRSELGLVDELDPTVDCFQTPSSILRWERPIAALVKGGACEGDSCKLVCRPLETGKRYRIRARWSRWERSGEPVRYELEVQTADPVR
jgi:hypothetical protein